MGKCSTTWLLLLVLLANELAVMRCGEAESKETQAEKLCETLGIKKPAGSEASTDHAGCITSMTALLDWKKFDVIKEIIHTFVKPNSGSVSDVERAKTIFTSKSWNDPRCISEMSQLVRTFTMEAVFFNNYVKPTLLPDLFVLLEKATIKTEDWWRPHLENKDHLLLLPLALGQIVESDASFKAFEIYNTWIKTNANKRCDELNVKEILAFATSQTNKFDATAFNTIFDIVCADIENNKLDVWRQATLGHVLEQPEMKAADLGLVKFVLQNCAGIMYHLTALKETKPNLDWTFQKILKNLQTIPKEVSKKTGSPENEVLKQFVEAHIGGFKNNLNMAQFESTWIAANKTKVRLNVLWYYIVYMGDTSSLVQLPYSMYEFHELISSIYELEEEESVGRRLGPFLKASADHGLSTSFITSILVKLKSEIKRPHDLDAMAPFIEFTCSSPNINCKGSVYQHYQIKGALTMFAKLKLLDSAFMNDLLDKTNKNEIKRDASDLNTIYLVLTRNEKCLTGLKSYFANFNIVSCSAKVVHSVIQSAIKGGWEENTEYFKKMYEKVCGESELKNALVKAIEGRSFDDTYKSMEECVEKRKKGN